MGQNGSGRSAQPRAHAALYPAAGMGCQVQRETGSSCPPITHSGRRARLRSTDVARAANPTEQGRRPAPARLAPDLHALDPDPGRLAGGRVRAEQAQRPPVSLRPPLRRAACRSPPPQDACRARSGRPQARPQARLQSSTRPTSNSSLPARHGLPNVSLAPLLPNARSPSRQSA